MNFQNLKTFLFPLFIRNLKLLIQCFQSQASWVSKPRELLMQEEMVQVALLKE